MAGLEEGDLEIFGLFLKEDSCCCCCCLKGLCREFWKEFWPFSGLAVGRGLLKELMDLNVEWERVGLVGFLGRADGGAAMGRGLTGNCICTSSSNMGRKVEENEMAGGGRFVAGCRCRCCPSKMPSI